MNSQAYQQNPSITLMGGGTLTVDLTGLPNWLVIGLLNASIIFKAIFHHLGVGGRAQAHHPCELCQTTHFSV